jgi:hypothetical protein
LFKEPDRNPFAGLTGSYGRFSKIPRANSCKRQGMNVFEKLRFANEYVPGDNRCSHNNYLFDVGTNEINHPACSLHFHCHNNCLVSVTLLPPSHGCSKLQFHQEDFWNILMTFFRKVVRRYHLLKSVLTPTQLLKLTSRKIFVPVKEVLKQSAPGIIPNR